MQLFLQCRHNGAQSWMVSWMASTCKLKRCAFDSIPHVAFFTVATFFVGIPACMLPCSSPGLFLLCLFVLLLLTCARVEIRPRAPLHADVFYPWLGGGARVGANAGGTAPGEPRHPAERMLWRKWRRRWKRPRKPRTGRPSKHRCPSQSNNMHSYCAVLCCRNSCFVWPDL